MYRTRTETNYLFFPRRGGYPGTQGHLEIIRPSRPPPRRGKNKHVWVFACYSPAVLTPGLPVQEAFSPADSTSLHLLPENAFTPLRFRVKMPSMSVQFQPPIPGMFADHPKRHDIQIGRITC